MTDTDATRQFTHEEIEAAVGADDPRATFGILITLFQRGIVALEGISTAMGEDGPVVLFEPDTRTES